MALISCPECGKKVSDIATACPDCGYPIARANVYRLTAIKVGDILYNAKGISGAYAQATITVLVLEASSKNVLGSGKIGEIIRLQIDAPTHVIIRIKGALGAKLFEGMIQPHKRYEIVKLPAAILGRWALKEIDEIDRVW